jgi:hypothetical protein
MRQKNHFAIIQSFHVLNTRRYSIYTYDMSSTVAALQLLVMDRPVVIRTSEPGVLAAVAEAYADWPRGGVADGPPIQLELALSDAAYGGPPAIEVAGARLQSNTPGLECRADARTLTAFCSVAPELIAQPGRLASEVLDTLLLFLLTRSGRTPIHAAGVMCGETAVLLAGPSGSGKSTLSLAAMARGLQILSDDTVYIQLQPRLRVWGFPRPLHVFPADAPGFIQGTRLRAGKLKAVVPLSPWSGPPVADRAAVVLLERSGEIRLDPIEALVAANALSRLEPGFDLLRQESAKATAALTASGAWRLTLARDPAAAIDVLVDRFSPDAASAAAPCV